MAVNKVRLDQYLVQNHLVQSRERAKALIMSGIVFVNEQKADKAGDIVPPDAKVEVRGHDIGFVSRGGLKLAKAMKVFPLSPAGKVCMDIGASTGGFTDCMLQNGAVKVYAVDVGYGQLAWKLRQDPRVAVFERTNIKLADRVALGAPFDLLVADLSFIGLGIKSPMTSWGQLCQVGSEFYRLYPYQLFIPGVFISVTILAFYLFGNCLRDALDPRLRGKL